MKEQRREVGTREREESSGEEERTEVEAVRARERRGAIARRDSISSEWIGYKRGTRTSQASRSRSSSLKGSEISRKHLKARTERRADKVQLDAKSLSELVLIRGGRAKEE